MAEYVPELAILESHEPDEVRPQLMLLEGGLENPIAQQSGAVCIDDRWYTREEFDELLGIGGGYAEYADRRPMTVNWLLMQGDPEVVCHADIEQQLIADFFDTDRYTQPMLQARIAILQGEAAFERGAPESDLL